MTAPASWHGLDFSYRVPSRMVGQLEPHGHTRLLPPDCRCSIHRIAARRNVNNAERDDVTGAELAVDGQIKQC